MSMSNDIERLAIKMHFNSRMGHKHPWNTLTEDVKAKWLARAVAKYNKLEGKSKKSKNEPITKAQIITTQKVRQAKKDKYKHANPRGLVKIYSKVTRIEAQKGNSGNFPGEKFFHNFKHPYPSLYGTPDRKTLVIK